MFNIKFYFLPEMLLYFCVFLTICKETFMKVNGLLSVRTTPLLYPVFIHVQLFTSYVSKQVCTFVCKYMHACPHCMYLYMHTITHEFIKAMALRMCFVCAKSRVTHLERQTCQAGHITSESPMQTAFTFSELAKFCPAGDSNSCIHVQKKNS